MQAPSCCSVPLNPRDPADIRFDGGDLIETSGGPLTLIHSQYPLDNFIGGSIEILSRQAVEAARSYSVPIGEDLYAGNTVTEPFHYVELELVAFEDTSITVDSPGAGSVSFDLARGKHWSSMGFIDDAAVPALGLTINAGTKVSTTAPISGMVFTGGDGTWATRNYTLLPDILHSTDYVTTAPGDNPDRRTDHQRHTAEPARQRLYSESRPVHSHRRQYRRQFGLVHGQHPGQLDAVDGRPRRRGATSLPTPPSA